ncbi:MAG: tetratricopeptide repeat protein [Elusimicrobia bacterium]|nr:tetratricopeptide repeat protein [Elusimicrobiota bacterium]
MNGKGAAAPQRPRSIDVNIASSDCVNFVRKTIFWWLPILYLLVCDAFYLRTYDSAQVKITLVQMGGVSLVALWVCRLLEEGFLALTKEDLVILAPFLASLIYGIFSFWHAPYHWSSTDFFIRRIFYLTVPLILIQEFNEVAVRRLIRVLIIACWVAAGYGCLQWFDIHFFPPGPGNGPDPFIWRGAFGLRVFSTYGNPNFLADYLVLMMPLLVTQWLKTKQFRLLILLAMDLFTLFATQTKGAWIALAITISILLGTYLFFFDRDRLRRLRYHFLATVAALMAAALIAVWIKLQSSFTSVNFRLFTWEATWEMIMTQPWIGTGIGSFWVIYPAFRRPPIFHIEGKHNTETDHSEDEYLEVLFDEGIIGMGIFLWLIFSSCWMAYRALQQMTGSMKSGERAPPRAYELLGVLVAFQGMLMHNFFDVSMRFVSSGVYLGLLSGLIVNCSRGMSLSELHAQREPLTREPAAPSLWETASTFFLWPARLVAWGAVGYMGWLLLSKFAELQGPVGRLTFGGEILQWWIAWSVFFCCVVGLGFAFMRVAALTRNALVPVAIALTMLPVNLAWGFFQADVYHNIAIFFSKQQQWEQALRHYIKVGELNPAFIMSFYFKGNVFNDRFNMAKIYNENWGDKNHVPRDDFERAQEAYDQVRSRAPNYVQMHHQVGVLYMKYGDWLMGQGRVEEANKAFDTSLVRFQMYRNIDPVFPPNYFRMGQIYMARKQWDKAAEIYQALIDGRECRVDTRLSASPYLRRTLLAYQPLFEDKESHKWVHRHELTEAYTNLGNAFFMAQKVPEALQAYNHALELDPNNGNAKQNLGILQSKVQASLNAAIQRGLGGPTMPSHQGEGLQFVDPRTKH